MSLVNKICKIIGCAVARCRSKITRYLIAPRAVKRMLHNGQQLNMSIAHFFDIGHKAVGKLPVRQRIAVVIKLP